MPSAEHPDIFPPWREQFSALEQGVCILWRFCLSTSERSLSASCDYGPELDLRGNKQSPYLAIPSIRSVLLLKLGQGCIALTSFQQENREERTVFLVRQVGRAPEYLRGLRCVALAVNEAAQGG